MPSSISDVLRSQRGVIHREQARDAGLSDDQIERLVRTKKLTRLAPRTFLAASAPLTWHSWAFAAILSLGPDAILVGASAVSLRNLGPPTFPVCVAIPAHRRTRLDTPQVRVLRLDVPETDRVVVDGLPTTTRLRTAVDVAHLMPLVQAQPILDRMLVLDMVTLDHLTRAIDASRRAGSAQARALMRSAGDLAAAESERHARRVLRKAGITGWTPNHSVVVRGGRTIKVDLALKRLTIAIEVKGWIFHSKADRAKGDDDRITDLQLAGWFVIPVGWLELMSDPEGFVAKVRAAIDARAAQAA
jgi:very-short-patch-repair endonuclease